MAETNLQFILEAQNRVSGQISEINTSLKQLGTAQKEAGAAAEAHGLSFGKLSAAMGFGMLAFNEVQRGAQAITGFFKDSVKTTEDLGAQTLQLQRVFGMTAEQGSSLIAVFDRFGLSSEQAIKSLSIFQKNMMAVNDSASGGNKLFSQYGIVVNDTNGKLRDMNSVLMDVADKFKNDIPITERAAAAKALFGRAGVDLIPVLIQGSQGIQELEEHARSLGVVLSGSNVEAIRQHMIAQKNLQETTAGLKLEIGMGLMPVLTEMQTVLAELVKGHGQAILAFFAAIAAIGALGAAIFGVVKMIQLFTAESFIAFISNPAMLALGAIAVLFGVVVFNAMEKMQQKMQQISTNTTGFTDQLSNQVPAAAGNTTQAMSKIGDQLATLADQVKDANATFEENMANMVQKHLDKVTSLHDQLDQENQTFQDAATSKEQSFKDSQDQMVQSHQQKVDSIQKQIDAEVAKGVHGNYQTLQDLRASLNVENQTYADHFADNAAKYQADVDKNKEAHDAKLAKLQQELDQENAFLQKHNQDVATYRNANLTDEMDKLKQSHDKQLEQFAKQKESIIKNAQQTTSGIEGAFGSLPGDLSNSLTGKMGSTGTALGEGMAKGMRDAIKASLEDAAAGIVGPVVDFFDHIVRFAKKLPEAIVKGTDGQKVWTDSGQHLNWSGRELGGPVSAGNTYVVGEAGPEMFVPNQSGTIIANGSLPSTTSGGSPAASQTLNLSISMGMYAGLPSEKRQIAVDLYREVVREARAHNVQLPQIGSVSMQ